MELYFIKIDGKYISSKSKIPNQWNECSLDTTFNFSEARMWTKLSAVKGQVTKLRNLGYKPYITIAKFVEERIEEQF